jgi:hypothetical protein
MESVDPANLKDVNKGFNKPDEYATVLQRLAKHAIFTRFTSFIFGMDNDTPGVAERTLQQVRTGLRACRSSDCSRRYLQRLCTSDWRRPDAHNRPRHWLDFVPFTWRTLR